MPRPAHRTAPGPALGPELREAAHMVGDAAARVAHTAWASAQRNWQEAEQRRLARDPDGHADLHDARELLAYWERRARTLPLLALRRRREARAMVRAWRERLRDMEIERYGAGLIGALALFAEERRLPSPMAARAYRAGRVAGAVGIAVALCLVTAAVVVLVALGQAVASLL